MKPESSMKSMVYNCNNPILYYKLHIFNETFKFFAYGLYTGGSIPVFRVKTPLCIEWCEKSREKFDFGKFAFSHLIRDFYGADK